MAKPLPLEDPAGKICALCLLAFDELCRSHIVPDYHFRRIRDEEDQLLKISATGRRLERKIQTGLFDRLLCQTCERHLNENFENEVHRLFESGVFDPSSAGLGQDYLVQTDYATFRLYMLSILWRASVSELPPFDLFKLGPVAEEFLRCCILNLVAPLPMEFPFIVVSLEFDGGWTHEWITLPMPGSIGNVKAAYFVVGGLYVCFILSKTMIHNDLSPLIMDLDGVQRLRRMHVNDIASIADSVAVIQKRYDAGDK